MSPVPPPLPPPIPIRRNAPEPLPEQSQSQQLLKWALIPLGCIIVLLIFLLAIVISRSPSGSTAGGAGEGKVIGAQSAPSGEGLAATGASDDAGGTANADAATPTGADPFDTATDTAPAESLPVDQPAPAPTEKASVEHPERSPRFGFYNPNDSGNSSLAGSLLPGAENPFLSQHSEASTVFVIDKSGSMAGSNLSRVVAALVEAIDLLKEDQSFQVVFFDDGPYYNPKLPGLSDATATNKRIAIDWLYQIQADGGTEPLEAMLEAIQLRPVRIVLLSDGEFDPSYAGRITQSNHTGSEALVKIDCVGVAETVASLQEIARDNGPGIYFQAK